MTKGTRSRDERVSKQLFFRESSGLISSRRSRWDASRTWREDVTDGGSDDDDDDDKEYPSWSLPAHINLPEKLTRGELFPRYEGILPRRKAVRQQQQC